MSQTNILEYRNYFRGVFSKEPDERYKILNRHPEHLRDERTHYEALNEIKDLRTGLVSWCSDDFIDSVRLQPQV